MKNYSIGGAKACIYAHTSILFDNSDITQEEANKIRDILDDYQYNHKDEEKADYLIFNIANKISLRKGLGSLNYYKCIENVKNIGIKTI